MAHLPTKRPTIRDVARLAGVSHTTVSFVINGVTAAGISAETSARVLAAIAQLDYHPNAAARTMSRRASRTIGVAIPDGYNSYYQDIVSGVEAHAAEHGYGILLIVTHFDADREQRCFQLLKQQLIDGLILIPSTRNPLENEIAAARQQGYPVLLLGLRNSDMDAATPELMYGEQVLLEHLAALGHQRIGYIYGVNDHEVYGYRLEACLRAQRALGIAVVEPWIRRCGPQIADAYAATAALLREIPHGERPSALVVTNDLLASGVIAALHAAALHVPNDMSVAAFDNTSFGQYGVFPALTTVDYDAPGLGAHAARILIGQLDPAQPATHESRLFWHAAPRLIVRGSTGPTPAR